MKGPHGLPRWGPRSALAPLAAGVVAALAAACPRGGPPPARPGPAGAGAAPTARGADASPPAVDAGAAETPARPFLEVRGEGADAAAAREAAVSALEEALFGPGLDAAALGLEVHRVGVDPGGDAAVEGGATRVSLGLERQRVEELLAALAAAEPAEAPPPALAGDLRALQGRFLAGLACRRRAALLDEPCEGSEVEGLAPAVEALARSIRLRVTPADGVPVDRHGRPLRPVAMVAERVEDGGAARPLPALPVALVVPVEGAEPRRVVARTDDRGGARFDLGGAPLSAGARASVARDEVAGILAPLWPAGEVAVPGRRADLHRWSLVASVRAGGRAVTAAPFGPALERALGERGFGAMVAVPAGSARGIRPGAAPAASALTALADRLEGRLDVLLLAQVASESAGRMGPYRVWYEARGQLEAYDLWQGRRLAALEVTAPASGIGDEAADQAAQELLAARLAEQLVAALEE